MKQFFSAIVLFSAVYASAGNFKIYEYQKFTVDLKDIYKNKVVHYLVPDNYQDKKLPLIIFLHGGGTKTPPRSALAQLKWDYTKNEYWGGIFTKSGAVVAAPQSLNGWREKNLGEYLGYVIEECAERYNIDTQKVYLLGWSMGGMGAYYAMLECPELFAAIAAGSGRRRGTCDFKNLGNAKAYIIHGRKDAVYGKRAHFTDVQFALAAVKLMQRDNVNFMALINDRGHAACEHKDDIRRFWLDAKELKQNLNSLYISGLKRNRAWITVEKYEKGNITVDEIYMQGEYGSRKWDFSEAAFNGFKVKLRPVQIPGGRIKAVYKGGNQFDIETENIAKMTVHMNSQMVDYSRPVEIIVNGKKLFSAMVKPLAENAKSYAGEYNLPGLSYDGKVTLELTQGN